MDPNTADDYAELTVEQLEAQRAEHQLRDAHRRIANIIDAYPPKAWTFAETEAVYATLTGIVRVRQSDGGAAGLRVELTLDEPAGHVVDWTIGHSAAREMEERIDNLSEYAHEHHTYADYRRAAAAVVHFARGDLAGLNAIVGEASEAGRGSALIMSLLGLYQTAMPKIATVDTVAKFQQLCATLAAAETEGN